MQNTGDKPQLLEMAQNFNTVIRFPPNSGTIPEYGVHSFIQSTGINEVPLCTAM